MILKIWRGVWAALGLEPWWLRPMECSSWLYKHMKRCSTWFPSFDTDTCCIDSDFVWMAGSQQPLDYFLGQPLHFYDTCRSLPLLLLFLSRYVCLARLLFTVRAHVHVGQDLIRRDNHIRKAIKRWCNDWWFQVRRCHINHSHANWK